MIPHSYLVHFELVQTCCLSSYAMHTLYFDHTCTRHQSQSVSHEDLAKARHPPEKKKKTRKCVIMLCLLVTVSAGCHGMKLLTFIDEIILFSFLNIISSN